VDANGEAITGANEAFVVEGTGVERTRPFPRPDLLEKIAEASGGSFTELGAGSLADIMTREGKQFRVEASTTRPLLQYWWCLAGMLVLLGCEWWMRRRWGFS